MDGIREFTYHCIDQQSQQDNERRIDPEFRITSPR
jgi:hypothetical protein